MERSGIWAASLGLLRSRSSDLPLVGNHTPLEKCAHLGLCMAFQHLPPPCPPSASFPARLREKKKKNQQLPLSRKSHLQMFLQSRGQGTYE